MSDEHTPRREFGTVVSTINESSLFRQQGFLHEAESARRMLAYSVRSLFFTLIARKNRQGIVFGSDQSLAYAFNMHQSDFDAALAVLLAPDPNSTTKTNEGRRVERVDGGLLVINAAKYRGGFDKAAYQRDYMRQRRESTPSTARGVAQTGTEAKKPKESVVIPENLNTPQFLKEWETWKLFRKSESKKPLGPIGERQQLSDLSKIGQVRAIAAIHHSISNNWQKPYEPSTNKSNGRVINPCSKAPTSL